MSAEPLSIRCPHCGSLIPISPEWRLVQCPKCGEPVSRMGIDPEYD